MTAHEIRPYRTRLQTLVARLSGDVARLETAARRPAGAESADRPDQEADQPAHRAEEDVTLALLGNENHLLAEASAALGRIDDGTFGRCETCGRDVPPARLNAVPYARRCVGCAKPVGSSR
jgi:DnaK suppressor protein